MKSYSMSTTCHQIFKKIGKFYEFLKKKNEENSYQVQNILEKSESLTIDVYYSV